MPVRPFAEWKELLLADAARHPARHRAAQILGDHVLFCFWSDDCEPTVEAMLQLAEGHRRCPAL